MFSFASLGKKKKIKAQKVDKKRQEIKTRIITRKCNYP